MGGCQQNNPCSQEIKAKVETQTFINDFNNKDIIIKDKKNSFTEEPGVSNEEIKISIPLVRSFSTTKVSSRNLKNKKLDDENINNLIKPVKRKSFNLTTANKTPSTLNNNYSNDNFNLNSKKNNKISKINKIEIDNFGINNFNTNIITSKKIEKKKNDNNQVMLNSLISKNDNDKINKKINDNNNKNMKLLKNIDNNVIYNDESENNKKNKKFSYENLQIEDIISEEKIHTKNNHEVVFRGNLLLINDNGKNKYETLFCVMSRINLKIYKNITYFLQMKKPLLIINLKLIKNIHIIKNASLGICFSLLDKYIFSSQNQEQVFKWIVVLNYFSSKLKE